jgi:hypothetical protein
MPFRNQTIKLKQDLDFGICQKNLNWEKTFSEQPIRMQKEPEGTN